MTLCGMSRAWMVSACVAALGVSPAGGAVAQDQPQYETPLYTTEGAAPLDKNYGLRTFGTPGSEAPQRSTTAKADPAAPNVPDFFKDPADPTDIPLPKPDTSTSAISGMETPLFTTSQGSSTTDAGSSTIGLGSSTDDTGSGARGSGFTTGDSTYSGGAAAR